jgi:hypothetical protein
MEVVVSACKDKETVTEIKEMLRLHPDVKLTVYEKCGAVEYDNIPLPNAGREQHTWAHHFASNFDHLAPLTVCIPGNFEKHPGRRDFLQQTLQKSSHEFACIHGGKLSDARNFTLSKYDGHNLQGSSPTGLEAWSHVHLNDFDPDVNACYFGVMSVRNEDVQRKSRSTFQNLEDVLNLPNPEAGHYMERLQEIAYG